MNKNSLKEILATIKEYRQTAHMKVKERKEAVYDELPRLRELDNVMTTTAANFSRELLSHPEQYDQLLREMKRKLEELKTERAVLLTENNIPLDYFDPIYQCNKCDDTGHTNNGEYCHCVKQKLIESSYNMSHIKRKLERENFSTFTLNVYSSEPWPKEKLSQRENMQNIVMHCESFTHSFSEDNNQNLLFYGPAGLGKTFLCNSIAKALLDKSYSYYLKAYENGIYDYYSLYALGYYQTLSQNYFEAQRWFLKSLEVKPKEALTNYNLAVTYLFDGLPNKGISYSIKAYEMYADSLKKGDAARITGILYSKIGDNTQALNYFYRANELSPNYRPNQMYLLKSYLQLDKDSLAVQLAYEVLITTLHGPEIAEEYIEMFGQFNKEELLYQVFDRTLLTHSSDAEACGNICFHYGKVLYKKGRKHDSKQMIKRSKKYFLKVFDKNHQVFEAIDQMLNISAKKPY